MFGKKLGVGETIVDKIGHAMRIKRSKSSENYKKKTGKKEIVCVEFAPLNTDGSVDAENWGPSGGYPGVSETCFDDIHQARSFFHDVKLVDAGKMKVRDFWIKYPNFHVFESEK